MAVISSTVLAIAAVIGAAVAVDAAQDQKKANKAAAVERKKVQGETNAVNAQKQAMERRQQIREERVRRGRIMQASENTGTSGSSGETGATGALSTGLTTNLGVNAGFAAAGRRIGEYEQNAADFNTASQNAAMQAQQGMSLFQLSASRLGKK